MHVSHPHLKIWIAVIWRRKYVQNLEFGTWCTKLYKMSTKLWSSFLSWNCISGGGCMLSPAPKFELRMYWNCISEGCISPAPQIWIAHSTRRNGVQNLGLDIQNCTNWVQNYDPVFYVETALGGLHVTSPQIWIADSPRGMLYKIWDLVYKIVQIPQIWIADSPRGNVVQNLGLVVQNCTK